MAAAAAGTFALSHTSPTTAGCSGSTTCSITLTASLTANNLATIQCYEQFATGATVSIQSVNVGGTLVPVYSTISGNVNTGISSSGYIYPTSATAGPVVVTGSGNFAAGATCVLREYTVSTGTPVLDSAHATLKSGTTSVTGETLATLSGSKDLLVQSNNTDYQLTTAVSTYTDGKFDATNGPGWADRLNVTSTTAPTWTIASGSGNAATNGMTFATDASACNDVALIDFSGGTNTNTVTAATLKTSTFGYDTTGTDNSWDVTGAAAGITYTTASAFGSLHTSRRTCGDGTVHTGGSTLGIQYDMSNATKALARFYFIGQGTKASAGYFYKTGLTTQTNEDQIGFVPTGTNAAVGVQFHNGTVQLECFGGSVTTSTVATISANTWYWITFQIDTAVGGSATVYETATWTSLGSNTCATGSWTATAPNRLDIGRFGGSSDTPAVNSLFSNIIVDGSGTYPLLP